MQCVFPNGFATCPMDVLIVEDDPLIALDAGHGNHGSTNRRNGFDGARNDHEPVAGYVA
jgi:hypothetical protein